MSLAGCLAALAGSSPVKAKPQRSSACGGPPLIKAFDYSFDRTGYGWTVWFTAMVNARGGKGEANFYAMLDGQPIYSDRDAVYGSGVMRISGSSGAQDNDSFTARLVVETECGATQRDIRVEVPDIKRYAAGGDSYSSGESNAPYSVNAACHTSPLAWPQLVAQMVEARSFANFACSGAKTGDLFRPFKGQPPQVERIRQFRPGQISLTIGGNDAGFGSVLAGCFIGDCVTNGRLERARRDIHRMGGRLYETVARLSQAARGVPILLVGYPLLFPTNQAETRNCGWLEPLERIEMNSLSFEIDLVLRRLAKLFNNVKYVNVRYVLKGHELCTRDSWVHPIGRLPLYNNGHPNAAGQKAIASEVARRMWY